MNLELSRAQPVAGYVDPVRLQQVLANLLGNALRHTPAGGQVVVSATGLDGDVVIAVRDSGEGVPPEELEAIFERFHRLDHARVRDGGGSGLGLTIARAIITGHGGTLTAASDGPGTGTTFTIHLPGPRRV